MYDYKEVVEKVNGLNSVSTLKKWRKKAEDLTGVTFKETFTGVRGKYENRIFIFSDDDINKFQAVVDTKGTLGLDQAILQVFGGDIQALKPIGERVELLEFVIMDLDKEVSNKIKQLQLENQYLKATIEKLDKRLIELEEQPQRKKLFKGKTV